MMTFKKHQLLVLLIFLSFFINVKKSFAIPSDADVLKGIKIADDTIRQGSLLYLIRHITDSPRIPAKYRDTGDVEQWTYRINGDLKLEEWTEANIKTFNSKLPTVVTYLQGKNVVSITPPNSLLYVTYERPPQLENYEPFLNLYPGPNFVLGRNISSLKNLKVIRENDEIFIEGFYDETQKVKFRAEVDPSHGYIAKSILRFDEDQLATEWKYGAPMRTTDGIWIPSKAVMWNVKSEGRSVAAAFRVIKANFKNPDDDALAFQLDRMGLIRDGRMGHARTAEYTKLPPGVTTVDELLPYTQQEVGERLHLENEGKRMFIERQLIKFILFALFCGSFGFSLFLVYRSWRRQNLT